MKRTAELLLWCALVAFLGYGVGSCGTVSAADAAKREARAKEQGYRLAVAYMQERGAKVDTVTRYVTKRGSSVDTALAGLREQARRNREMLADSGVTLADLRARLETTTRHIQLSVDSVVTYRVTVDSLIMSHLAYRQAAESALVMADSTIAALQAVIDARRSLRSRLAEVGCRTGIGGSLTAVGTLWGPPGAIVGAVVGTVAGEVACPR